MSRPVTAVRPDAPLPPLLTALAAALDGGPALRPVPLSPASLSPASLSPVPPDDTLAGSVPDDVALLLPTSGSTGEPKLVELTGAALRHSAQASLRRLGGPGSWLLALPLTHVAGWQVLVRTVVAGTDLTPLDLAGGFDVRRFAAAARSLTGERRYTALVPTQLTRLLDDPDGAAALAALDGVLLGGAAAPAALLTRARAAGVPVVTTYGMTETCGGCVYDGRPLDGVQVHLEAGRILIAGPVLARGYRHGPDPAFTQRAGAGCFVTADAGRFQDDGTLQVLGRVDDVLVTGGENVAPTMVEDALTGLAGVGECVVVGIPDPLWGQAVTAVVVPARGARPTVEAVREALRPLLPVAALPRHLVLVETLPRRGPGKPDRAAVADLARRMLHPPG